MLGGGLTYDKPKDAFLGQDDGVPSQRVPAGVRILCGANSQHSLCPAGLRSSVPQLGHREGPVSPEAVLLCVHHTAIHHAVLLVRTNSQIGTAESGQNHAETGHSS